MLLYPHHAGLGPEALEVGYTIQSGGERLRVASVDLLPGASAVIRRLGALIAPPAAPSLPSP